LGGYSEFIGKVRELERPDEELTEAISKAIKWCISHNILKDFLEQNGSEVINMLFNEFDMEAEWEAGFEKGWAERLEKAARNALAEGLPVEVIREITGLDLETFSRLSLQ
jgi:hypothetical protein